MTQLQTAVLPSLLFFALAACDDGGGNMEEDTSEDTETDVTVDTVEDTEPDPIGDPEPEVTLEPAAPFAVIELFTSEG